MHTLSLLHFVLNAAGLLLWLKWREDMLQSARRAVGGTLLSTLKRAGAAPAYRWAFFGSLGGMILLRAILYWQMGASLRWSPAIDLGAIVIVFRCDIFLRMLMFSLCSMAVFILKFHFWLLLISVVNRKVADTDVYQNRLRAHLGLAERLPWPVKLLLPFLVTGLAWLAAGPLLAKLGFLMPARSMAHTVQQAVVLGAASYLCWKYLLAVVLMLYLVTCYVYLGHAPIWNFLATTGRNLLAPIQWLPLRLGRLDFAPIAGAVAVLFVAERVERWLPELYRRLPW
jgi:uncharacterized protein YggT (Ycf19 family)